MTCATSLYVQAGILSGLITIALFLLLFRIMRFRVVVSERPTADKPVTIRPSWAPEHRTGIAPTNTTPAPPAPPPKNPNGSKGAQSEAELEAKAAMNHISIALIYIQNELALGANCSQTMISRYTNDARKVIEAWEARQ